MKRTAYILLGGNLENTLESFAMAIEKIQLNVAPILKSSSIYESDAWGYKSENKYLNQVISIKTSQGPETLLQLLLDIEKQCGRSRNGNGYVDRNIDIDLLTMEDVEMNTTFLKLPHPRMQERRFTLAPLCEIAPHEKHVSSGLTFEELLNRCTDYAKVKRLIQ